MSELDDIINGNDSTPAPSAPVAGRARKKVEAGGTGAVGIELAVNGSFVATYNGFKEVQSKFPQKVTDADGNVSYIPKMNKLYSFTLLEPAKVTQITKDEDGDKVKTKVELPPGETISIFSKGNLGFLLSAVSAGSDIEVVRLADDTMKKGEFAGAPVQSYEVFELD